MKKYDLRSYGFGVGSEIQVENEVIEKLAKFYGWDENKIQRHIESDIVEILEEREDEDLLKGTFEEELTFAKEDYLDASTYEQVTFKARFEIDDRDVYVTIEK